MVFESLTSWVQPWADVYAEHTRLATVIIALHVLAMFIGGGMAVAADRSVLRAKDGSADAVRTVIADLATTHSLVITALGISVASGLALFASDVPTYSTSVVYWVKMGALVALLLNGVRLRRAERAVLVSLDGAAVHTAEMPVALSTAPWSAVRSAAWVSASLWITIVLLGVLLSNG